MEINYLKIKNWCKDNKYFIVIMFFALALLLYRVDARAFWMDEAAVLVYLKESPSDFLVAYWQTPDNHPPLYYFLVLLVSKILPWTEMTIRLVSILAGLGIVWLVYIFTFRVTNDKRTALLAVFFTVFSSYFVLISQMARYHSLAAFLSLLVFYYFYRLFVEGYNERVWRWYLAALVLVGYVDYPHFFYTVVITNILYLYGLIRHHPITSLLRWYAGQLIVAILYSPMVWLIYNRIFIQGDRNIGKTNLLSNSWENITGGILFHIYSFFFGENLFPWNYIIFSIGLVVLFGMVFGLAQVLRKKILGISQVYILLLSGILIVFNTFFMNIADTRYNFIVYPKFVFVAFPLWVMSFVLCLSGVRLKKIRMALIFLWAVVAIVGLTHFYQRTNYVNGSYFNDFKAYELVKNNALDGDLLVINGDLNIGIYNFYKEKYFSKVATTSSDSLPQLLQNRDLLRVWFFSTGSDGDSSVSSMASADRVPDSFNIIQEFQSVPIDSTLLKLKQKITGRQSYKYKYGVYLLTNK